MNIGIIFADFGPYHAARIEALAIASNAQKSKLFAFRFSRTSNINGWKPVIPEGVEVITLAQRPPVSVTEAFRLAIALWRTMKERGIQVVFLPSYSPLPNLFCLFTAKFLNCKTILMNESWHGTEQTGFMGRLAKQLIVRLFDAALVGGTPQKKYACAYGLKSFKVFLGYDIVDVNYYAQESKRWKELPVEDLPIPNLPARYFLNLGRFVPKKNIEFLIRAYAQLVQSDPAMSIALVLVGEGSEENAIRQLVINQQLPIRNGLDTYSKSINSPEVVFYPFQQIDKTPLFYSRCEAFILPSLYEEWGLVINEAMACGAAVLVSENVGCAQDLVEIGKNGFLFNPKKTNQLSGLLQHFINDSTLAKRLGEYGFITIRQWGPERFSEGALNAIQSIR